MAHAPAGPKLPSQCTTLHLLAFRDATSITVTMNGYPPPMGVPASPWRAVRTAEGKEYYHNAATNATTWEKPDELKDEVEVCPHVRTHNTL